MNPAVNANEGQVTRELPVIKVYGIISSKQLSAETSIFSPEKCFGYPDCVARLFRRQSCRYIYRRMRF